MSPVGARFRSLAVNLALAGASVLLCILVVEGGARLFEVRQKPRAMRADYIWDWRDKMPGGFYVIRSEATGWPPWEEINGDGLRDRSHAVEKPLGRHRLVLLGDSVTLGDQILPAQAYPQALERLFDERGQPVEVFNVALWGWSTRQQRTAWDRIARKYSADSVVLAVCLNDIPELQNNLSQPPSWLAWIHGHSAFVRRIMGAEGREIASVEELFAERDSPRVKEAFARFFGEVRQLRKDVIASGASFSVIVFPFRFQFEPGAPDPIAQARILEFCRSEGVTCLDMRPVLAPLGVGAFVDYDHLSPAGAQIVASTLASTKLGSWPESLVAPLAGELRRGGRSAEPALRWLEAFEPGAHRRNGTGTVGSDGPAVSRALAKQLESSNPQVRQAACWALRRLEIDKAEGGDGAPALTRRLSDESEPVRAEAARALGVMGKRGRPSAEALFAALRDPTAQVRWAAARALFDIGLVAVEDVARLAAALASEDEYVRGFAAFSLGELGPAAVPAVPALAAALDKPDGYGRGGASAALAKLGPLAVEAVPALIRGLRSEDGERRWKAARTLGRIGPGASAAVPVLVEVLSEPNERVRAQAARALGRIAPNEAKVALRKAQGDPDPTVRDEARKALVQ